MHMRLEEQLGAPKMYYSSLANLIIFFVVFDKFNNSSSAIVSFDLFANLMSRRLYHDLIVIIISFHQTTKMLKTCDIFQN